MFVSVAVSLYTSRVVLDVLGFDDYGVYSLVAGIAGMLCFMNASLAAASSRFLSYELATPDISRIHKVFSTAVVIHILLAIAFLILAETIGLWYIKFKIVVPDGSRTAAMWVYQCSVVSIVIGIIQSPYNALIIAKEKMSIYAYIEIVNVFLKLGIVYILYVISFNKLISYGVLTLLVSMAISLFYVIWCRTNFIECRFSIPRDRRYFRPMLSFSCWNLLGDIGYTLRQNGSNIILNLFFGPIVNAANGIAMTVQGTIMGFSTNVITAMRPPIIKDYSRGDKDSVEKLLASGTKLSLILMLIVSGPIFINAEGILKLWLKEVPEYCVQFTIVSLMCGCVACASNVLYIGLQAANRIKWMNIIRFMLYSASIFILWGLLSIGLQPVVAYYLIFVLLIITTLLNLFLLKPIFAKLNIFGIVRDYVSVTVIALICIFSVTYTLNVNSNFIKLIITTLVYIPLFSILCYLLALNKFEKSKVRRVVNKLLIKLFTKN